MTEDQAKEHIKQFLTCFKDDHTYPFGRYRGYVKGWKYYARQDGGVLTDSDLKAIETYRFGQVHYIDEVLPCGKIVKLYYSVDSSG